MEVFPSGPFETNAYVVACPTTKEAAIIDPGVESADAIIAYVTQNRLRPTKILITHSHWDHIGDVARLKAEYDLPVYIHALDAPNLEKPGIDGLRCWMVIPPVIADYHIDEGDEMTVGTLRFNVIHTPGHSPGGICFYCEQERTLFSGDTLFQGTIGNLSFPTADPELMWQSLKKLAKLPPETDVFPGHGPATKIEQEKWLAEAEKTFG